MRRTGLILFFLLVSVLRLSAQGLPNSCVKTTEGKEFWFGFMENRNYQVPQYPYYLPLVHYLEITLVSVHTCNIQIFIGKSATPVTATVYPNIPLRIPLQWEQVEAMGSETPQDKAIHLISDFPLNLYALNWCENSADVAVIYPVESIGNEYYTMCYTPNVDAYFDLFGFEYYRSGRNSQFLIVATEDNTKVTITPSRTTDLLRPAQVPFDIILNKGELFQVQSLNHEGLPGQGDLTGSLVKSDKPVALFSGSLATTVPALKGVDAWDHLYEQVPPLNTWGKTFVTVPLVGRSEDVFRVLASRDNTLVKIGSNPPIALNRGEFYDFVLKNNEPRMIESNQPVLLAQYMVSNSVDRPPGYNMYTWDGDPFMVLISPVSQTIESVTFVAYDSNNISNKYYVNIVAKEESAGSIFLDGSPVLFQSLPNSGYSYAQVKITRGSHELKSSLPGNGFTAYVYGYGGVESYGYGVGFNLNVTLDLGGTVNASGVKEMVKCAATGPLTLHAGEGFATYAWSTGETTSSIQVMDPSTYSVTVTTLEGCTLEDVVTVLVSDPVIELGPDREVCAPEVVELDAGSSGQLENYTWTTPDGTLSGQKISVSASGLYKVEGVNAFGCKATDQVQVDYLPEPLIDLGADRILCSTEKVVLDAGAISSFSTYQWSTPGGTFTTQTVEAFLPGEYSVEAKTDKGCLAQDKVTLGFSPEPVLDVSGIKTLICGTFSTVLDVTADRPVEYLVSSSPEVRVSGLNLSVDPSNAGTYPVTITARDESSCETVETVFIGFYPTPDVGFTLSPEVCLGQGENQVSYLGTGNTQDTYQWDLSDFSGSEIVSDPGITQGPFVFNLKDKPQASIGLEVASKFGCHSEKATLTVKRKPAFTFLAGQTEGCVPLEVNFTAETGDPVDQLNFFWNFGGSSVAEGMNVAQTFDLPGEYNLTLRAVSSLTGCSEEISEPAAVVVHPNPEAGFSVKPEMVYNDQPEVTLTDESQGAMAYNWDFGDGTTSVAQNPVHRFQSVGIKKVVQTVFNEFNCFDSASRDLTVGISKIFAPNAFSPNAANAVDREFKLIMGGIVADGYHLRILSRWNDVVFDCRDVIRGWDGKLSNGAMAPPGNYVWILEFRDFLGKFHRQTGTVALFY